MVFSTTYHNLMSAVPRSKTERDVNISDYCNEYKTAERMLAEIDSRFHFNYSTKYLDDIHDGSYKDPDIRQGILWRIKDLFGNDYATDVNLSIVYKTIYEHELGEGEFSPEVVALFPQMASFHGVDEIHQILMNFKIDVLKCLDGKLDLSHTQELVLLDQIATVERFVDTYHR